MTDEELKDIEKACAEATPGEWFSTGAGGVRALGGHYIVLGDSHYLDADSRFIAAARSWVPALVAEVRRLRAEVAEEREACAKLADSFSMRYGMPTGTTGVFDELAAAIRARGGK